MKKVVFLLFLCVAGALQAQMVESGKMFIDARIGLGIQHYTFKDVTNNVESSRDTSASIDIPISFEYAVKPWLGFALNFSYSNYIEGDSASAENARGIDIVPAVNLHVPWGLNKLDLYGNIGFGYSNFRYTVADNVDSKLNANGTALYTGLNLRWLFSTDGHVGMNFYYRHAAFNYPNGELTNNNGLVYEYSLKGPGNSFGLGFFGRF